jgi:hypothetical protein
MPLYFKYLTPEFTGSSSKSGYFSPPVCVTDQNLVDQEIPSCYAITFHNSSHTILSRTVLIQLNQFKASQPTSLTLVVSSYLY